MTIKRNASSGSERSEPGPYLVFAPDDGLEQALLGAVEGQAAGQQDEEDDAAAPHVHRLAVGLALHHLRGHEVGRAHTTWKSEQ